MSSLPTETVPRPAPAVEEESEDDEEEEMVQKREPQTWKEYLIDLFWRFEDGLASICGMNQSKYEWAVRDHYYYKKQAELEAQEAAERAANHPADAEIDRLEGGAVQPPVSAKI